MRHAKEVKQQRGIRAARVRRKLKKTLARPRLAVFRSHQHMYAQVIDDAEGKTLVAASTADKELKGRVAYGGNVAAAAEVGKLIAERALAAGIKQVALDRRDYKYHGRVAALADAARDAGLDLGPKGEKPEAKPKGEKKAKGEKKPEGKAKGEKKTKAAK